MILYCATDGRIMRTGDAVYFPFESLQAISHHIAWKFGPQADVTMLHKRWIDCDITINNVYFDVAFNLPSNYYVVYF
jgi:hypothetical protein